MLTKKARIINELEKLTAVCQLIGQNCRWCINAKKCAKVFDRLIETACNQPHKLTYESGRAMLLDVLINHPEYTGGPVTVGQEAL